MAVVVEGCQHPAAPDPPGEGRVYQVGVGNVTYGADRVRVSICPRPFAALTLSVVLPSLAACGLAQADLHTARTAPAPVLTCALPLSLTLALVLPPSSPLACRLAQADPHTVHSACPCPDLYSTPISDLHALVHVLPPPLLAGLHRRIPHCVHSACPAPSTRSCHSCARSRTACASARHR